MATMVRNLTTGEEQVYTCTPSEAVVNAYEQEKSNYNTWDYRRGREHGSFAESARWYRCGEWVADKS